jgi:hypothetical protein
MAVPHYVGADVSSDDPDDEMTYYTHHSKMAVPHYVCAYVSSDHSADCITYYIDHS